MNYPITLNSKTYVHGVTHNTKFHSDDVMCAALLQVAVSIINDDLDATFPIMRCDAKTATEIYANNSNMLVFDIANSQYDHHLSPRETRPNGIPYAGFGKLWRDVGAELAFDEKHIEIFDRDFVQAIDLHDNEGVKNPMSIAIAAMNCDDLQDDARQYECFEYAVKWATTALRSLISDLYLQQEAYVDIMHNGDQITRDNDNITAVVYDHYIKSYWVQDVRPDHAMIYPHARGGWSIQCLKTDRKQRILAPSVFRGKPYNELRERAPGMRFCHASGFLMSFDTKEQAIDFFRRVRWYRP